MYSVRLKTKWELYFSTFSSRSASSCSLFWRMPLWCCGRIIFQRRLKPVACTYIVVQFFLISLLFWLKYFLLRKAPFSITSHQDVTIFIFVVDLKSSPHFQWPFVLRYCPCCRRSTQCWTHIVVSCSRHVGATDAGKVQTSGTQNVNNTEHSSRSACKYSLVDCDAIIRES